MAEKQQMAENRNSISINEISNILFESAAEGLVVADQQGIIQVVNPRIEEMFGYEKDELIGQKVEVLIPHSQRSRHKSHRKRYNQHPSKRSMGIGLDLSAEKKDGSSFPVEVSLNHFEAGGQMLIMALVSDVTERKKADMALVEMNHNLEKLVAERTRDLRQSQHLYSIISRNFPNGTINVFDRDLNYIFIEGQELAKLGIKASRLIGTNYLKRLAPEIRETIREKLMGVFEGINSSFEVVFKGNTYMINAVALPDENGEIPQILVVEQNMSRQKKAENDILEALSKEKQLSELKSRFVSMASHEFRTPLTTIFSSLSILKKHIEKDSEDEKKYRHIQKMRNSVRHLTTILDDFLSIDKLEEGKIEVNYTPVHIPEFFGETCEEMQETAKQGQKIVYRHEEGPENIFCDKQILKNTLHNLISNAVKYSGEGKTISLRSKTSNEVLYFSVKDEGMGIPLEEQNHLFERFFRAKNATNIQGTGLGLSIVKKYIELCGGSINFESIPGEGTTFFIEIPSPKKNISLTP